jgi:putative ABC transport system substrate-binding protein
MISTRPERRDCPNCDIEPGQLQAGWVQFLTRRPAEVLSFNHRQVRSQGGHMRRREFITLIGGAAALPLAALAQQPGRVRRVPNVGILNYAAAGDALVDEFRSALSELGHIEGQTLTITYRWADGGFERLPSLAAELIASKVDVIIALGPATWAAKGATNTVPVVIAFSGDPVGNGVVSNLARPGGNITGFSYMSTDLAAKRLELLSRTFQKNGRIGILYNPAEPATTLEMRETEAAARTLGVILQPLAAQNPDELNWRFEAAMREQADALIVFTHGFAVLNRRRIVELAARQRLPTMYGWREFVDEGGLMSYGPNVPVLVRKAAGYVDRIIKGEKPGDLPIEQPVRLELIVNLKTAKALDFDIPPALLAVADAVIE